MNIVILRGVLSSEPVQRELPSGSTLWSLEVTTSSPDGSLSVPVVWFDPRARPAVGAGDAVVVVGSVRRRFFRSGASTQSRTEVVAAEVVPERPASRSRRTIDKALLRCQMSCDGTTP